MSVLHVPPWAWAAIIAALAVLLGADLFVGARRRRPEGLGEAALWTAATIALAVAFGALIALAGSGTAAGQFFAGWLTEYSLSLDNLLVFVLLISSSRVARQYHGRVLLLGILLALVLRGVLIALGSAALHQFAWVEYLFGALLIYGAARIAFRGAGPLAGSGNSAPVRVARRIMPVAPVGEGARLTTRVRGRRHATPLLILVIAVGVTDVLFAVDSIPAIFGLTHDPFLVFAANLFALLGLRHLYFLVSGLLNRLVYLPAGLAVILGFIGLKLIGEALLAYGVDHLGPVPVPHVGAGVSLAVIAGVLLVTTVSSLASGQRREGQDGARDRAGQAAGSGRAGPAGRSGPAGQSPPTGQRGDADQPDRTGQTRQPDRASRSDHTRQPGHTRSADGCFLCAGLAPGYAPVCPRAAARASRTCGTASPVATLVVSPVARCVISTTPSARPRLPTVTRTGIPVSSASRNFTPARSARSSMITSIPAAPSSSYSDSPTAADSGSSDWATVTTTLNGATATGQTMPRSSWWRSTMAAMARSTPIP
jgi:tellurite resistance protein TerC